MSIDDKNPSHLSALGWDTRWSAAFDAACSAIHTRATEPLAPARVIAEHRERYVIGDATGDRSAVLSGKFRHETEAREAFPCVGDWVLASSSTDGTAVIRGVVPRRGAFVRKAAGDTTLAQVVAANVDVAFIATALPADLNARRLERYLTLAWESGATPVVLLTKSDLADDLDAAVASAALAAPGVDVLALSAVTGS